MPSHTRAKSRLKITYMTTVIEGTAEIATINAWTGAANFDTRRAAMEQLVVNVTDTHPAAQPAVGMVAVAQPLEFACRARAVQRRVQPQTHHKGRVDGRAPDAALDGADARV